MSTLCLPFRRVSTLAVLTATLVLPAARAQNADEISPEVTASDRAAARQAKIVHRHALPNHLNGGSAERNAKLFGTRGRSAHEASDEHSGGLRFPGDVSYHGGQVVKSVESHAIYMLPKGKCPVAQCWGDPEGFLKALGESDFIHIVDQYVGQYGSHRYGVGTHAKVSFKPQALPFTDADIEGVVHAVAKATGKTGYGHLYHVFLPEGVDECFDNTYSVCYSPDNYATFYFCAYHSSVDFNDIGHVLYSVEPYQNAGGCNVRPGTPNGELIDSTNNVLSHETFETITDPDGDAWTNTLDNGLFGEEVGDECQFLAVVDNFYWFDVSLFQVGSKHYAAQPEYDNAAHACAGGGDR